MGFCPTYGLGSLSFRKDLLQIVLKSTKMVVFVTGMVEIIHSFNIMWDVVCQNTVKCL